MISALMETFYLFIYFCAIVENVDYYRVYYNMRILIDLTIIPINKQIMLTITISTSKIIHLLCEQTSHL